MKSSSASFCIAPGGWLGIMGGGQLGRMFCHAAQSLGYKVAVLHPGSQCPAGMVADLHIRADYDDVQALDRLSQLCPAVTTEFENVPAKSLERLAQQSHVSPSASAVAVAQDRIREKAFIQGLGIPVAPYAPILSADDLVRAPDTLFPGILKAARLGYDGKGQVRVESRDDALWAFAELGGVDSVLEAYLPLDFEISVVMARGQDGETVVYVPAVNEHRDGILAVSTAPLHVPYNRKVLYSRATQAALHIAEGLNYCGVLGVEFFVLRDGDLVVNEIAPRPHNSGHYTMNASTSSQFEQQVRAMAGLPLGGSTNVCACVMLNILGDVWFDASGTKREPDWAGVLMVSNAKLHLYGKLEARHGRKMGHVNVLGPTLKEARQGAARVAECLGIRFRP